jgi:hypothetical protein
MTIDIVVGKNQGPKGRIRSLTLPRRKKLTGHFDRDKLRRRHNRNPVPGMQHQQVLIAADQRIGIGGQHQS